MGSQCECANDKCADSLAACLSDATCADSQACALACACSDDACILKCAAASPSSKALPVASCIKDQCGSAVEATGVDCSTAVCQSQCECANDKCADSLAACLSDATCADSQACALACACNDDACILKCAA